MLDRIIMSHPLICWDIISEGISRRKDLSADITALNKVMADNKWHPPVSSLDAQIVWENKTVVVTDTKLQIIYASSNMFNMNGYRPEEVIGKHPSMFQGEATSESSRKKIRAAIQQCQPFECEIINYKKNGSLYNCWIEGYPVFNVAGELVNFIALENSVN
jgi:PAS domain S-box-containing protein